MKKTLILPLLMLTWLLPAQRDPQWLMPLYFRDANGDRDTVYFGYDPEADMYDEIADTALGENWIVIDTSKFNVYLWNYPNVPGGTFYLINDTVRKVDIRSNSIAAEIGFCKGKLPITMKWVDSLLYAPSCPFPDLSPRPRARIDLTCYQYEWEYYSCNYPDAPPLSLTDYPALEIPTPVTDSMVFNGSGLYPPSDVIGSLTLWLVAHNLVYIGIEIKNKNLFSVYPNPFTKDLTIENPQFDDMFIEIVSVTGTLLYRQKCQNERMILNLELLNKGLYLLVIRTNQNVFIQKIFKTEYYE
jgi:hypothetical protein